MSEPNRPTHRSENTGIILFGLTGKENPEYVPPLPPAVAAVIALTLIGIVFTAIASVIFGS